MRFKHEHSDAFAGNDVDQLCFRYPDPALAFPDKLCVVCSLTQVLPDGFICHCFNYACTDAAAFISNTAAATRRSLAVWQLWMYQAFGVVDAIEHPFRCR